MSATAAVRRGWLIIRSSPNRQAARSLSTISEPATTAGASSSAASTTLVTLPSQSPLSPYTSTMSSVETAVSSSPSTPTPASATNPASTTPPEQASTLSISSTSTTPPSSSALAALFERYTVLVHFEIEQNQSADSNEQAGSSETNEHEEDAPVETSSFSNEQVPSDDVTEQSTVAVLGTNSASDLSSQADGCISTNYDEEDANCEDSTENDDQFDENRITHENNANNTNEVMEDDTSQPSAAGGAATTQEASEVLLTVYLLGQRQGPIPDVDLQQLVQAIVSIVALQPNLQSTVSNANSSTISNSSSSNTDSEIGGFGSFEDLVNYLFQAYQGHRSTPAAAESAISNLPKLHVTENLARANPEKCVVCQDCLCVGEIATSLPCNHMFHHECLTPWLKQVNSCPVCRYEMPMPDPKFAEYENDRMQRMKEREAQFKKNNNAHTSLNENEDSITVEEELLNSVCRVSDALQNLQLSMDDALSS